MAIKKSDLINRSAERFIPSGLEIGPNLEKYVDERLDRDYRPGGQVIVRREELVWIVQELKGFDLGPTVDEEDALMALYTAQGWRVVQGVDQDGLFMKFF